MDTQAFRDLVTDEGYTVRREISGDANKQTSEHAHDWDTKMLVLSGDITYSMAGSTRTYRAGDILEVSAGAMHSEKMGASGVRLLVASR